MPFQYYPERCKQRQYTSGNNGFFNRNKSQYNANNNTYSQFSSGKQTVTPTGVEKNNRTATDYRQLSDRHNKNTSSIKEGVCNRFKGTLEKYADSNLDQIYCGLNELTLSEPIDIPIVRYTKAEKTNKWNVSVQTSKRNYMPLANFKENNSHVIKPLIPDIRDGSASFTDTVRIHYPQQILESPHLFCASVDKVSKMNIPYQIKTRENIRVIKHDEPRFYSQDPRSNSENLFPNKPKSNININQLSRINVDANSKQHVNTCSNDLDLTHWKQDETSRSNSLIKVNHSNEDNLRTSTRLIKSVKTRSRSADEAAISKSLATNAELSRSSSDIFNETTISDVSVFDESDPDWCFDLHGGTTDDTSISEVSPNNDQMVRGNRLLRFVNKSKRKIIPDIPDEEFSKEKRNRLEFEAKCDSNKNNFSPSFICKPSNCTVMPGEIARFECSFVGHPKPEIVWFLHDNRLNNDQRTKIKVVNNRSLLELDDVTAEESGTIKCVISNQLGKSEVYTQLIVQDTFLDVANKSVRIITPIKNIETIEGSNIRYKCKIYGNDFDIRWYHNGKLIVPDKQSRFTDFKYGNAILEIKKVKPDDSGVITCFVSNSVDQDKTSSILKVNSKHLK